MKKRKIAAILLSFLIVFLLFWTTPNLQNGGTIKIYDRNHILLYEAAQGTGHKIPVTFDKLPKNIINETVSSEDETFWSNAGVDFPAIIRSAYLNFTHKQIISGASTITQQLARVTIISPNENLLEKYLRKIREMYSTPFIRTISQENNFNRLP